MGECVMIFLTVFAVAVAEELQEQVLLEDIKEDYVLSNLDAGLPSNLTFKLRRPAGDVLLTLVRNRNLNVAAPIYELDTDENGRMALHMKNTEPLQNVGFYHDKRNQGSFSVRCMTVHSGQCARTITGNFLIDNRTYNIEPDPDIISKRGFNDFHSGTPHRLTEIKRNIDAGLDVQDFVEISETEGLGKADPYSSPYIVEKRNTGRQKRSKILYAVEMFLVVDPSLWERHYDRAEATDPKTRDTETEQNLREYLSHIINGASLRYESIEDPEIQMYLTITGFLFFKTRDETNPLPPGLGEIKDGIVYVQGSLYLQNVWRWYETLDGLPESDHIMCYTAYDLYGNIIDETGVAGISYTGGACQARKVSVIEESPNYFQTTTRTAHELGHNLGAFHDGTKSSAACSPEEEYIMAPSAARIGYNVPYHINPYRFSPCSVNAFKDYIAFLGDSRNCLTDPGDYWNHEEYLLHSSKLPGELYDADTQCKLMHGDISQLCWGIDLNNICKAMGCLTETFGCRFYRAAAGTECGGVNSNKWCIDGACVDKNVATPTPTSTVPTTTTPVPTSTSVQLSTTTSQAIQCAGDVGLDGFTCNELKDIFGMNKLCKFFSQECCGTCGPKCQGNKDFKIRGTTYNCETALTDVLYNSVHVLCRIAGKDCCEFCI